MTIGTRIAASPLLLDQLLAPVSMGEVFFAFSFPISLLTGLAAVFSNTTSSTGQHAGTYLETIGQ